MTHLEDEPDALARRSRLRWILFWITLGCLALGAVGFAFVRWLATLPPGTLKAP